MAQQPEQQAVSVCLLGGGGVGKSAVTLRFVQGSFVSDYDPTIEDSYRKQTKVDGAVVTLNVTDTAGQEEFVSMQDDWIRGAECFLLVYGVDSEGAFEHLAELLRRVRRGKDTETPLCVVLANKADLEGDLRVVDEARGRAFCDAEGLEYLETSALNDVNVTEAFHAAARLVLASRAEAEAQGKKKKRRCVIL